MPNSRKAKPQLRAPYFFHMFDIFTPTSERSLYTFRQIVLNRGHYCNSKTYLRYRAWEYSCITHNCLIAEQKHFVVNSVHGRENDQISSDWQDYRDEDFGKRCLLLTINDEFWPHVTELLPQNRSATPDDMYRALQILRSYRAQARHPGDIFQLEMAIADFERRQRALYVKAWERPA